MHIAIIYGTGEGQTEKVSRFIADSIRNTGHTVTIFSGSTLPEDFTLNAFDAAIIGASIHLGQHQPYMVRFVKKHKQRLRKIPTAFFSVSLSAHSAADKAQAEVIGYIEDFLSETQWQPNMTQSFAGALKYLDYSLFRRMLLKSISTGQEFATDTSQNHEYTKWQAVDEFALEFVRYLNEQSKKS